MLVRKIIVSSWCWSAHTSTFNGGLHCNHTSPTYSPGEYDFNSRHVTCKFINTRRGVVLGGNQFNHKIYHFQYFLAISSSSSPEYKPSMWSMWVVRLIVTWYYNGWVLLRRMCFLCCQCRTRPTFPASVPVPRSQSHFIPLFESLQISAFSQTQSLLYSISIVYHVELLAIL